MALFTTDSSISKTCSIMKLFTVLILWLNLSLRFVFSNPQSTTDISKKKLFEVAGNGDKNSVLQLIQNGINNNEVDLDGSSPLMYAAGNNRGEIVDLLLKNGANVNQPNIAGESSLMWATQNGSREIVAKLIQHGADVNRVNDKFDTALLIAVVEGYYDIVNLLLQNGGNSNDVNINGKTALMISINKGHENIANLLVKRGANINTAATKNGNTALHIAAKTGREEMVKMLLQNGANRTIRNRKGYEAKDLAIEYGFPNIHDLLINHQSWSRNTVADKACDVYSKKLSDRILGGELVESGEFPWMAALGYIGQNYRISFDCGGTLISEKFVLTAAHCVRNVRRPVIVRLGKVTLTDADDGTRTINHQIEDIIRHPNYSHEFKKNDIALLRLVNSVWFTDDIKPACLQTDTKDESPNVNLTVTGWGIVSAEWRNRSKVLLKTDLKTMPLSECNQTFLDFNKQSKLAALKNGISESQYCAIDSQRSTDSCDGDSGGPLQIIQPNVLLAKIVGIVSFGVGCGSPLPGIYTRVGYYSNWIESIVWPNRCNQIKQ